MLMFGCALVIYGLTITTAIAEVRVKWDHVGDKAQETARAIPTYLNQVPLNLQTLESP